MDSGTLYVAVAVALLTFGVPTAIILNVILFRRWRRGGG